MVYFLILILVLRLGIVETCRAQSVLIPENLTFCDEPVPLTSSDVRERLETQLLILSNQKVQVTLWLKRKDQYLPYIETILKKRKLPVDLKYIPVIESALIMRARSSRNASGLWQFMLPTGRERDLIINDGIDERLHLEKATSAALDYLVYLRSTFGSWSLALAAYNLGQGRIKDEIYNQGTSNYYDMVLPEETERYVFSAIAAKLIFENAELYGFEPENIAAFQQNETREIQLHINNFVPVKMLAFCAGTSYRMFRNLNPWIIGVNLEKGNYTLKIPSESVDVFHRNVQAYFKQIEGYTEFDRPRRMTIKSKLGHMRVGPGMEYPAFRILSEGDTLRVAGRNGRHDSGHFWYIFKLANGASGWIWGGELTE
jgi:membrane-bound lytic murein transglycosylase D